MEANFVYEIVCIDKETKQHSSLGIVSNEQTAQDIVRYINMGYHLPAEQAWYKERLVDSPIIEFLLEEWKLKELNR